MSKMKQTAGRDFLEDFAPEFAHFNDDILFGENWNNQDIEFENKNDCYNCSMDVLWNN